jgi:pantetheine-phosphate adenylyltransferase
MPNKAVQKVRVAVYPGTFDPVTNGHMDMIQRAAGLFDRLTVGVAVNAGKGPLFELDERVELLQGEIQALPPKLRDRIEVRPFSTLLMHFCNEVGASLIVRGLRAVSDFEYEFQMAGMNRRMDPDIETIFLMASETNQFISSRFVKEIARLGGNVSSFVSPRVARRIDECYARSGGVLGDGSGTTMPARVVRTPI